MSAVLALDQGTTSSRAILFDQAGRIQGMCQTEFRQIFPQAGWVEHDANEIWESQKSVAQEVLRSSGLKAPDVAAVGITNQRETTILWDRKTGKPIHNAIVWQDRRTAGFCDSLKKAGHGELVQQKTGLVIDAYFSGSKVRWLLDNVSGARAKADRDELAFGTVDAWLIWNLTGGAVHVTDASNASRTMLFNIQTGQWDDELLRLFNVPRSVLPEVKPSSGVVGESTKELFGGSIKIAGNAGDQQAALFGQTCFVDGLAKNTYGTGCFMLMNVGSKAPVSQHKLLATVAWQLQGKTVYALEGSVFAGGAVVQWLRDGLGLIKSAADIESPWPPACPVLAMSTSCRRSQAWEPHTGISTRAAPSRASRVARPPPTSLGPASKASPSRWPTFSTSCRTMPRSTSANSGSTAAPPSTTCSCNFRLTCSAFPWSGRKLPKPRLSALPISPGCPLASGKIRTT